MSVFCYASRRLVSFIGTWEDSEGWGFTKISEGSKHPEIACGGQLLMENLITILQPIEIRGHET
ncbi:hypothetical protein DRQ15_08825 [candidate division KSB1 bacterium]|nr:MAG: hypothetical protein DRQ15_08825 [candidate division KSB1 bacterium]